MALFSTDAFLRDIKHVDKDLRLMALFDLRRHLPSVDDASITSDVVERVLFCLSLDERCEDVQNEAANVLPELVIKCNQRDVILVYLLSSVTKRRVTEDSEGANVQYLCGIAFKKCCTELASEARRSVAFWQKQLDVVRQLCSSCVTQLEMDDLADTAREVVYSALNALVPAYRDVVGSWDAFATRAVRDFLRTNALRHASLTLLGSLLPLVRADTQEAVLTESLRLLESAASSEQYVTYLQLCDGELRALGSPAAPLVQQVLNSVCKRLARALEQYDEVEDNTETLLEVVCSLIQLEARGDAPPWEPTFAAVKELASFNPCAGGGDEEDAYGGGGGDGDDEYDEYYEYYEYDSGGVDSSWRLRMWAVRVVQMLVAQHDNKELGVQALMMAATALQDRIQAVQLEAVKLVRAVIRRSYARDEDCAILISSRCRELCHLVGGDDDKATASLMRALTDVFEVFAGSASFLQSTTPLLLKQVRAHFSVLAGSVAAIEGCRSIVASVVRSSGSGAGLSGEVVGLAKELPALCLCGASIGATAACIPKVGETLAQVYTVTRDPSVPAVLGNNYGALLANREFPVVCRAAAAESLAAWAAVHGLAAVAQPSSALWSALDSDDVRLPALRAVGVIAGSEVSAAAVPAPVLEKVVALVETGPASARAAAVDVLLGRLAAPQTPPPPAAFVKQITSLFAPGRPLSLASCELAELRPMALLLTQCFRLRAGDAAGGFYDALLTGLWDHVAQLSDAVQWSRSFLDPALDSVTALLAAVYEGEAASRPSIEHSVRGFLVAHQVHIPCISTVVGCIGAGSAPAVCAFLHTLRLHRISESHLLLCVGAAGQASELDAEWSALVLDSVQSKGGEWVRSCGELALSLCMLHCGSAQTTLMECCRRAADGNTVGRYYYVKSIKEAATAALARQRTAFHDAAVSGHLLQVFLHSCASPDLVELYGACAGILSVFLLGTESSFRIADAMFDAASSLDTRVTCMVALRYFLGTLAERSASIEAYRPVVLRALLQLRRPASATESTAPSLPLRSMALRLLTTVLQSSPQWLLCEEMRSTIFPNLLVEMHEDAKLQGAINLSGFTHRLDKGLECRKLAFESLSGVLWAARQRHVDLVEFCGTGEAVATALIKACSAHSGDRDSSINDTAKDLLVRFVESRPTFDFTAKQLDDLVAKLSHDIKCGPSSTDAQRTTVMYTIKCVMKLGTNPVFARHGGFQEVAEMARRSALLAQSLRM